MSEYKRLISYIYNYEKGIKKSNVGFTKIELRNGQCRISINIKAASLNGQKLRIYAFYRENKKMIQILLAESGVKNGGFEWKGITSASNIMNTGHNFDQLGGVLLYYSKDKYFATEWDDQPIILTHLYEWDEMESWKTKGRDTVREENKDNMKIAEKENSKNEKVVNIESNKGTNKKVIKEVIPEPKFIEVPRDEITYIRQKKEAEDAISKSQEEIVQSILKSIDSGWELFCNSQNDTKTKRKTNTKKKVKLELQGAELDDEPKTTTNIISEIGDSITPETAKLVGYRFINWYRSQETGFPVVDAKVNVANADNQYLQQEARVTEEVDNEEGTVELEESVEVELEENIELDENIELEEYVEIEENTDLENEEILVNEANDIGAKMYEQEDQKENEEEEVAATLTSEEYGKTLFEEEQSFYEANTEKEWNERLEEVAKKKTSTAERILHKYPAIYPFEDDEIDACVRIEPGDIGLFPIENWVLGNNSFLLHGYYNFRHLIFAKRKVLDGEEYILGVPGVFQNREKFMAKMFGFSQFKCSRNVEQKTGEFGYWYLKINM